MKCPKCGYTSFDYNESCPRCRKDMASERHRLNLPDFTPNPPYLLGFLSGEVGAKKIGIETEKMAPPPMLGSHHLAGPEDSQALHAMEMAFEADQAPQIELDSPVTETSPTFDASLEPTLDPGMEKAPEGMDLLDLSLDDLEPPSSLTVESAIPEDEVDIDLSSAPTLEADELGDLDDDLIFGEDEASLDESLGQISGQTSGVMFLDDEAELDEASEGPLDLDKLASMVESINEDEAPPVEGPKRSFDPSLGVEHMMEDELPDLDVGLGHRSNKE